MPRTSKNLVRIGMMPAAREGDSVKFMGADAVILEGEPSVRIEGKPAARMTDPIGPKTAVTGSGAPEPGGPMPVGKSLAKLGRIALGCPVVRIGMSPQAKLLAGAAAGGTAFLPVGSGGSA